MPKADPAKAQRIGRRGEARFVTWCEDTGLVAQKSEPDLLGWDFFVEVEPTENEKIPLDREVELKKALVQVKSTNSSCRTTRASLSALKRLVDSDLPAFIIHIDFCGQIAPARVRLLHIWKTQMECILMAIRRSEKKGRRDINKIELRLSLAEAYEISANGENLKESMLRILINDGASYIEEKARFRRVCGWNKDSIVANFSIAPGQESDALVDLLIGKIPELRLTSAVVDKRRFGISLDQDIDRLSAGILKVTPKPISKGRAIALSRSFKGKRVEVDVDVYVPGIGPLPPRSQKIRVANSFLEITMNFGKMNGDLTYCIEQEKSFSLHELADFLAFGVVLAHENATLEVELGEWGRQNIIVPPEASEFARCELLCEFAETLSSKLLRYRRTSPCNMSIRELQQCLQENQDMFALLTRPGFEVDFALEEPLSSSVPTTKGMILMPIFIEFGSFCYVAIIKTIFSRLICDEVSIKFVGAQPDIVDEMVVERPEIDASIINNRIDEIKREESMAGYFVVSSELDVPAVTVAPRISSLNPAP